VYCQLHFIEINHTFKFIETVSFIKLNLIKNLCDQNGKGEKREELEQLI